MELINNEDDESFHLESSRTDDKPWHDLIQNLSFNELEALKNKFTANENSLQKENFCNAINEIFGNCEYGYQSLLLFEEHSKTNNKTTITWSEFLDLLLANLMTSLKTVNLQLENVIAVPHTKRETIVKIVLIETEKYFCYAMISKHGRVGLYDGNLDFLTTYHLIMTREDISRKEQHRRRRNRWVTDAIFCKDILMFIVTNTARSVVVYEASGLKHVPLWLILSTPNIVECFAYKCYKANKKDDTSILFMGDSSGAVTSFNFLQPKVGLLRKKHNDKINLFYWDELSEEKEYILIKRHGKLHKDAVKNLIYFDDNETLISCSRDPNVSVMKKYLDNKNKPTIFKMHKGTNSFAFSELRKLIITGSEDGILRIWNPIITSKAIATLKGHSSSIVDVKIIEKQNLFLSCSSDGVLKLWDISEQKCVQSLNIEFPSFKIFGKLVEWGIQCIYPGPKRFSINGHHLEVWERSPIIIACCNYIALIKIVYQDTQIENGLEMHMLPPPPLQNSVLVPQMWKTSDDIEKIKNKDSSDNNDQEMSVLDPAVIEKRLEELKFILEKDLFADNGSNNSDINYKIATLERKKLQMQQHVERGAPYLALDLHEVKDLHLTPDLPVPNKRKIKNFVANLEKVLQDATFRDFVFSEPSSSRSPRSSRSSIVEFEY